MQHFKLFLAGQPLTLHTDHEALTWLRNFKDPEGQLAHWLECLEQFHFETVHHQGHKHANANALSWLPCHECNRDAHFPMELTKTAVTIVGLAIPSSDLRKQQLEDNLTGLVLCMYKQRKLAQNQVSKKLRP